MGYLDSSSSIGGKITLDRDTFKVLASETRIGILKKLDEKQMTVSDLARALEMNKATLFEHLEKLIDAGLIKKKEDERKWVYYTLTWKGKNILHPERMKIAIVLSISILCSILLVISIIYIAGSGIFGPQTSASDYIAPTINFSDVDEITEKTVMPEVIIEVSDNKGINESSLKIEYTITDVYMTQVESFAGWQELTFSRNQSRVNLIFPSINWSNNSGKYLYVRCSVSDKSGNSAQNVFIEYIEKVYEHSADLCISVPDVEFDVNIDSIPDEGIQTVPLKIKIHNTGSFDVHNAELSIFHDNPDTNGDGLVDDFSSLIQSQYIDSIESKNVTIIKLTVEIDLSKSKDFWVVIDPLDVLNETDELNNIIKVSFVSFLTESVIPEFSPVIVLFAVIFVIILFVIYGRNKCKIS